MNATKTNREIYDNSWSAWEEMKKLGPASRWQQWLAKEALTRSGLSNVRTILDFGCGTGVNAACIANLFPASKVTGCDISQAGIDIATRNYKNDRLHFILDDGTISLQKKYDLICCFEVLEHLAKWKPLLQKMLAHSRYIILSTPTGKMRPFEATIGHIRNLKRGELEHTLLQHGATARVVYNAGFPFYSPLYRDVCQLTNIGTSNFIRNQHGAKQRIVSRILYVLFRYCSLKSQGDQFCGVFSMERNNPSSTLRSYTEATKVVY